MNKTLVSLCLLAVFTFTACNKKQQVFSDSSGKKCVAKDAQFKYLSVKAKVKVESEELNQNFTLNMRIKKDEIIWLSASYIIEGLRCYITPDSVKVIDRLKKNYYTFTFEELSRQFKTKVNFQILQSVLLGTLPKVNDATFTLEPGNEECKLTFSNSFFVLSNFIRNDIHKLNKLVLVENATNNEMVINYSDFKENDKNIFPFQITTKITENKEGMKKTSSIDLEYKKIKTSKQAIEFPFTVSDRYEKL